MYVELDTDYGHYSIADVIYNGRPARVLYSGSHDAAQSGMPMDGNPEMLFDYNRRFFELVEGLRPKSTLMLGGGGFTLPTAIARKFPDTEIDVIELDPGLVDMAQKYFEFEPSERVRVHVGDARRYIDQTNETYNLVMMDVFTHDTIPMSLVTLGAAQSLRARTGKNGVAAVNIIASLRGRHSDVLLRLYENMQASFRRVEIFPVTRGLSSWTQQNFLMVAQDGSQDVSAFLRYPPIELPGY